MRVATIRIERDDAAALREAGAAFVSAWHEGRSDGDVFTFSSPGQLFAVLSPKRWDLIERLQALGPSSLRGLARALGRDVKRVHEDAKAMIEWGFVERREDGRLEVPYGTIHADFDLKAVA